MPYNVQQNHPDCPKAKPYGVVGPSGLHGCHETKENARAQQSALYAAEQRRNMSATETQIAFEGPWGRVSYAPVTGTSSNGAAVAEPGVTVEVEPTDVPEEPEPESQLLGWRGILGFIGYPTDGDSGLRRFLMPGGEKVRPLPQTLSMQPAVAEQHQGAVPVGRIDTIEFVPPADFSEEGFDLPEDLPDTALVAWGTGVFDSGDDGTEAARLVHDKIMRGVSLDPVAVARVPLHPETFAEIDPEALSLEDRIDGNFVVGFKDYTIAGATIVAEPAFGHAILAASGDCACDYSQLEVFPLDDRFVACAAGPIAPPAAWLADPKLKGLTVLTVTDEGRVFGHVSTWDCHSGAEHVCMRAVPSRDGYAAFHSAKLVTAEGEHVRVGRILVKPHAPRHLSAEKTVEWYSDAKRVAAFVRLYEDAYGIAAAGVTRSDAPPELLRDFYGNPPSIEQRRGVTLGISSVPFPGLPVAEPEAILRASDDGVLDVEVLRLPPVTAEMVAAAGESRQEDPLLAVAELAGTDALLEMLVGEPEEYLDDFASITAAQRKQWAASGVAMKDGSFPITKCKGEGTSAENARLAIGRAPEGKRPAVKAHIAKRESALSC